MKKRYEVRPDGDRWVVWDTQEDRAEVFGWRFYHRAYADDAAQGLNEGER